MLWLSGNRRPYGEMWQEASHVTCRANWVIRRSEDVAPPVQHVVAREPRVHLGRCKRPQHHHFRRGLRRDNRRLRRDKAVREPRAERRAALDGLTCDARLEHGAASRPGGVTVAALLKGPIVTDDADDEVRGGGNTFFGCEEVQLACARRTESRK